MATDTEAPRLTVTCVRDHPDGYRTARVSANGTTVDVDDRYGSWQAVQRKRGTETRREVLPPVARVLQKRAGRKRGRR